jgi:hypothetical protein
LESVLELPGLRGNLHASPLCLGQFIPLHRFPTYLFAVAATYTVGGFVYGVLASRNRGGGASGDDEDEDEDEDELAHGHGLR